MATRPGRGRAGVAGNDETDPDARARACAEREGARGSRRIAGAQKKLQALQEDEDVDTDEEHEP